MELAGSPSVDVHAMRVKRTFAAALPRYEQIFDKLAGKLRLGLGRSGKVCEAVGTLVKATGVPAQIGEICKLSNINNGSESTAEVIGFSGEVTLLSPMGGLGQLGHATQVVPLGRQHTVRVGDFLLGRVVDGMGQAFLNTGPPMPQDAACMAVLGSSPAPLDRPVITQAMPTGIRAMDSAMTCGIGQRVGVFAPAGCGKSTLLAMLCNKAEVDVTVVALVGERGREVADFIEDGLGAALAKAVIVVSTSDRPANERLKAASVATTYAEYFRAQGKSVLLLVDSVTRIARAAREIGLAAGEPPTRRGFPPSVFSMLPQLFERAGRTQQGSITAFYTVLEETDDGSDPISEEVRSLLDGHIVLSRKLANKGHFPAIDVLASISRLMPKVADQPHLAAAQRMRELMSKYNEVELLLRIGEYQRGNDELADAAIDRHMAIESFLRQGSADDAAFADSLAQLEQLTA